MTPMTRTSAARSAQDLGGASASAADAAAGAAMAFCGLTDLDLAPSLLIPRFLFPPRS